MEDFIIRALLAGVGIGIMTGLLGCFIVWQRMAYFGETLAHSALLGIALGLWLSIAIELSILLVSILVAFILIGLSTFKHWAMDSLLGVLAHISLALGLAIIHFLPMINLESYLFGDVLTIQKQQVYYIYIGAIVILSVIVLFWRNFVLVTIDAEIAQAEGKKVVFYKILLLLLMALVVALAMQLVGILLLIALLIIPATAARPLAKSPYIMVILAIIFSILAVILGILTSVFWDIPTSPAIVLIAGILFIISLVISYSISKVR